MSEIDNAAEAPIVPNISGFMLPSYDKTFINTCVSWKKSDGNSGLIGLSVSLEAIITL